MIGTETGVLKEGSAAQQRIIEYGNLVKELHIIVLCKKLQTPNSKFQIPNSNVFVYPTNSLTKFNNLYLVVISIAFISF